MVVREEDAGLDLDTKVELTRGLISVGLTHVHELLDDEVVALAGPRGDGAAAIQHGSNSGTVRPAGQRTAVQVPRVRGGQGEMPLRSYQTLHGLEMAHLRKYRPLLSCLSAWFRSALSRYAAKCYFSAVTLRPARHSEVRSPGVR
jgi:hypothetical protein